MKTAEKKIIMSSTALDEHDKIKEMWAFNLPCMLLVNEGREFWVSTGRDIYKVLYKDILIKKLTPGKPSQKQESQNELIKQLST